MAGAAAALTAVVAGAIGAPPGAVDPVRGALGGGGGDLAGVAWGLWRVAAALPGLPSIAVPDVLVPEGARLLVADLPEAIAVAPVTWALGPVAAVNLLQVLHLGLAAALATALAVAVGTSRWAAPVAGACFGLSPVLLSSVHNGNPDVTPVWWLPLAALLARRAGDSPLRGLAAGLAVGVAAWCNPYCGVMAAVAAVAFFGGIDTPLQRSRRRLASLAAALAGVALSGGAYAVVQASVLATPGSMVARGEPISSSGSADLAGLFSAAWEVQAHGEGVHAWYLGVLAGLLAVAGWRGGARALALVAAGVALGLGPLVRWDAADIGTWSLPGPWALLGRLPGLSGLHIEYRFVVLAALGLGLLAARGTDALAGRLWRGRRPAAALLALGVAADLLLCGRGPALLRWGPAPLDDAGCRALAGLPDGPVLDLPGTLDERGLLAQACHGRPVAAGLNRPWSGQVAHALKNPPQVAAGDLARLGYRYVLIHEDQPEPPPTGLRDAWAEVARSGNLPVAARGRGVLVVDLGGAR